MASRVALIEGTGLIGGSVGLGLRSGGWTVVGWDPDADASDEALRRGAIDSKAATPDSVHDDAELIVLAGPPAAIIRRLPSIRTGTLVTDVSGVKRPIIEAAAGLGRFVGGHPMAGGLTSGPAMASSTMFHGAPWVITEDGAADTDIETVSDVVHSLGANPIVMTAAEHDRIIALVSHLPRIVAAALAESAASEASAMALSGGGFRDLTRGAGAVSGWWSDILAANAADVAGAIAQLEDQLRAWKDWVLGADAGAIEMALASARIATEQLTERHLTVGVVLADHPGEIARVGHALGVSGVDVRDLQIRHGEHGGGGILTISVSRHDESALRAALRDEGFTIQEPS